MTQERSNSRTDGAHRKLSIPHTLTFTLSVTRFGALSLLLLLGLGWAFILGIMVGRGYQPEKEVPPLARLLPPSAETNSTALEQTIMKPEELTFMNSLRNQPPLDPKKASPSASPTTDSTVDVKEQKASTEKKTVAPTQAPSPSSVAQAAPDKKTKNEKTNRVQHDYVFQVASFKVEAQADTLRQRLEGAGMRTALNREKTKSGKGTWYKVQVLLRGNAEKAEQTRAAISSMGLGKPILRSKTPAKRR